MPDTASQDHGSGRGGNDQGDTRDLADLDAAIAGLYGGPPEEFVAARKALVGSLRAAGRRDDAAVVAKLRKPSRAAWALDAAALAEPDTVTRLVQAAEAMAAAQETGSDRGDRGDQQTGSDRSVRAAMTGLRDAVRALAAAASRAAAADGHPMDAAQMAPYVLAVVGDQEALASLCAGRLIEIPEGGGFGSGLSGGPETVAPRPRPARRTAGRAPGGPAPAGRAPRVPRASATPAGSRATRRKLERAEGEATAAREAADAARKALAEAETEVANAERAAGEAAERAREADERLRAAQRAAREATEQRVAADRARVGAERRRERARHRDREARRHVEEAERALEEARRADEHS